MSLTQLATRANCVWLALAASAALASGCGQGTSPTAPSPPPPVAAAPPASPPGSASTVLRRADFQGANGYRTEGTATITVSASTHTLELLDNFRAGAGGIVLDVRLCRDTRCVPSDPNLGPLRGLSGPQTFALPDDGAPFRFVVIWCRPVNLAFGVGELR